MTAWILSICAAATGWGCGMSHTIRFPSEESCYRALREMRMNDQFVAESGQKRTVVAYCFPSQEAKK